MLATCSETDRLAVYLRVIEDRLFADVAGVLVSPGRGEEDDLSNSSPFAAIQHIFVFGNRNLLIYAFPLGELITMNN